MWYFVRLFCTSFILNMKRQISMRLLYAKKVFGYGGIEKQDSGSCKVAHWNSGPDLFPGCSDSKSRKVSVFVFSDVDIP